MTHEERDKIIQETLDRCLTLLRTRAQGYAKDDDALHNFRVAAEFQDCTMAQALAGMMAKHTVSIYDMVRSGKEYDLKIWDEKICDNINYLLLLKAVVCEDQDADSIYFPMTSEECATRLCEGLNKIFGRQEDKS